MRIGQRRHYPLRPGQRPAGRLILPATRLGVFSPPCPPPSKTVMLRSGEVETVEVHDFVPRRYEVVQELLLGVRTTIDSRQGPELGVRTEDEVHTGGSPL